MEPDYERDRGRAVEWARNLLAATDWVVLDLETTGLADDAQPVEIAVLNHRGETLLDTRVCPSVPIEKDATRVHGITNVSLNDAPMLHDVWEQLANVMQGKRVIIYNAAYDKSVLEQARQIFNLPELPASGYDCAMVWYAQYYGQWNDFFQSYTWQHLSGGKHTALSDCLATYTLIQEMAQYNNGERWLAEIEQAT
ncbi:MAG: 3'-5' exonuclease [Chloroflexi bacterium]|nr:3'-5' exonuclease [Chloroflexota bacterium]